MATAFRITVPTVRWRKVEFGYLNGCIAYRGVTDRGCYVIEDIGVAEGDWSVHIVGIEGEIAYSSSLAGAKRAAQRHYASQFE